MIALKEQLKCFGEATDKAIEAKTYFIYKRNMLI